MLELDGGEEEVCLLPKMLAEALLLRGSPGFTLEIYKVLGSPLLFRLVP